MAAGVMTSSVGRSAVRNFWTELLRRVGSATEEVVLLADFSESAETRRCFWS